jgi:glyoxylase-like metal-dependent hydrolase (beta-lactamase superfamily II)
MKIARFQFQLFGVNTYVVWDENTLFGAVIDPGMSSSREEKALTDFINREKIAVKHLINTHLHIDHAASDRFVCNTYGVNISAHRMDASLGERLAQQADMFGLPFSPKDIEISTFLEDGDTIEIGDSSLQVLHVPGHSKGSIALYDKIGKFILTGDALFAGSIGRTDLPGGSMTQLLTSIKEKILTLPEDTIVYPGHGDPTTVGDEIKYNPFLR